DPVDMEYQDNVNPDIHIIPANEYRYAEMMPQTGEKAIPGGFDPPRLMLPKGQNAFCDLWQTFRETMVYHYVKDIAAIAAKSGFPLKQYYTHQIPADYFEGTQPNNANPHDLNSRYYTSASPLWTAWIDNKTGMGISLYDINYGNRPADTSQYVIPAISAMSGNWAAVEANPEVIPASIFAPLSPIEKLYNKMMRLYDYHIHFLNFFKWKGDEQYQFKETGRGLAAKLFFDNIKDKARQSLDSHFTPKKVEGFTGIYRSNTRSILLNWSAKIWLDLNYSWDNWGDFKEFIIYRGYEGNFQCSHATRITGLTGNIYEDTEFEPAETVYYKIVAANISGETGEPVTISINTTHEARKPTLKIFPSHLDFGATEREGIIPVKTFTVSNIGIGTMNWTAHTDDDWISITPNSGVNSGLAKVTVNSTGKTRGTYNGSIRIYAPGAADSPHTISVTMIVYPSGFDEGPFGAFELPVQGSIVQNMVSFTGWALDDIGIKSIKIYLLQGSNTIFVGDALLIDGTRPDIMTAYPGYPNSNKAGWSYVMLTRNLPNQGNGIFTFKVTALDGSRHETTLGTRTITCLNAESSLPFGAIDTPLPGGIVAGKNYRNHGWALTPLPNMIPSDGSTIDVYIDSIFSGHPVYNIRRPDVASLLPGYANSNRAHAYLDIDTTILKNGMHTIYWLVRDNAGNTNIIGSRTFIVLNPGVNDQEPVSRNHKPIGKK
ncbi:MAG: BACON domain-containing protein, partial [Acidobacteria bacterium]|nr:BACON domain-containing protein [Acidobacteriota bacterium]